MWEAGGELGGGWDLSLGRICSFASDPELQLVHLFQLVLSPQSNLANQWGKHAYISKLLDPGSGLKVSSLFFIFFLFFPLFCIFFAIYDCTCVISVMFCKNVKKEIKKEKRTATNNLSRLYSRYFIHLTLS